MHRNWVRHAGVPAALCRRHRLKIPGSQGAAASEGLAALVRRRDVEPADVIGKRQFLGMNGPRQANPVAEDGDLGCHGEHDHGS